MTYISAVSVKSTCSYFLASNSREIEAVSEKLSLQPSVGKAIRERVSFYGLLFKKVSVENKINQLIIEVTNIIQCY